MSLQDNTFTTDPSLIQSLDEVKNILLNRIPQEYQSTFFTPLHPLEMPVEHARMDHAAILQAKDLILDAIQGQKRVVIFGDYDCDGVTATAVLWLGLKKLGFQARPFLPRRDIDGYGLSVSSLQKLWNEESFEMLITVDNGIVAHEAVAWLREKNVKVIITDHHAPQETLPDANVIVHSSLLSGVGVAWMLVREMVREEALDLLDLVVIGTLADQVPVYGGNRSLVVFGLDQLRFRAHPSLRAIAEIASLDLRTITSTGITFTLAPRINALGRLADPMDALRALVSSNPERILRLVARMEATNQERQDLTSKFFKEVQEQADAQVAANQPILVVQGPYHEGIIGLLASKLVDQHRKPAIVISTEANPWKASCRSLKGLNIIELLRSLDRVPFVSLGGHSLAAGFSLSAKTGSNDIETLKTELSEKIPNHTSNFKSENVGTLPHRLLNTALLSIINEFQPFGAGNSEPQFWIPSIQAHSGKWIGKQQQHWKGELTDILTQKRVPAIYFRAKEKSIHEPELLNSALVRIVATSFGKRGFDIQIVEISTPESQ